VLKTRIIISSEELVNKNWEGEINLILTASRKRPMIQDNNGETELSHTA
jgi:hypothetical protein